MVIDVYLQIEGIKGESAGSAHQGWIELTSVHMGVIQPRSATASTAGGHTSAPDAKISCSGASDYRERNRGDLSCTYTKDNGYSCYFGLNVLSGKSTHGVI